MLPTLHELTPYLTYATPPLLGAFIGYLTNRVAIRMLFRPLTKWHIGPLSVPMTPGVIPSKRHDFAVNIGEMVGEHLLTSEEINNSLQKEEFQEHLYSLIETKIGSFLKKDLGPITSLVAPEYNSYFDIGYKTTKYQIKETLHTHIRSEECSEIVGQAVDNWLDTVFARQVNEIISPVHRQTMYDLIEENLLRMFLSPAMGSWTDEFVANKVDDILQSQKSLEDILPQALNTLIIDTIRYQTPKLLDKGARIIQEPEVREKLVATITYAVEEFIATLGPMAAMVSNFLSPEVIEEKIRVYFSDKKEDIAAMLTNEEVQIRVAAALTERAAVMIQSPIANRFEAYTQEELDSFSREVSHQLVMLLRKPEMVENISRLLKENFELHLKSGTRAAGEIVADFMGQQGLQDAKRKIKDEIIALVTSQNTRKIIDSMIDNMLDDLLRKPVGRLDSLIPAGVRDGLYSSLQTMATRMLTSEVPGIVKSLNIRKIVSERIDSFDLLRLEKLLLSIMEEQFKYINLFGALLGFLIGCANLLIFIIR